MQLLSVGKEKDIKEGEMRMVRAGKREVLVVRLEDGYFAVDGWCSHMQASLDQGQLMDHSVRCRVHGAVFDLATGKLLKGPGAKDLRSYPVVVQDGMVLVQYSDAE